MNLFEELPFHSVKQVKFSKADTYFIEEMEDVKQYRRFWQHFQLDRARFKNRINEFEKKFMELFMK